MFWVYVLENPRGMFYVGQTGNIEDRLADHDGGFLLLSAQTARLQKKRSPTQKIITASSKLGGRGSTVRPSLYWRHHTNGNGQHYCSTYWSTSSSCAVR